MFLLYTRKTWVYFLKHKSETFSTFKDFKVYVEKHSGYNLKMLRTVRGGDYTSNIFLDYCRVHGIKHQVTASYSPQQNGIGRGKTKQ